MDRRRYNTLYVLSLVVYLLILSVLTDGFTELLEALISGTKELSYSMLMLNITGGIIYVYVMYRLLRRERGIPLVDSMMDVLLVLLLFYVTLAGFLLPVLVSVIIPDSKKTTSMKLIILISFLTVITGPVLLSLPPPQGTVKVESIENPISFTGTYNIVPPIIAYSYAKQFSQNYTVYEREFSVYYNDNTPMIIWLREPRGVFHLGNDNGAIIVFGDRYPVKIGVIDREVKYGLHNSHFMGLFFDNLKLELRLHYPMDTTELSDSIVRTYNGHIYIIIPVVKTERGLSYTLTKPEAYIVVDENGSMKKYSYQEALRDSLFEGIPLIPKHVATNWIYNGLHINWGTADHVGKDGIYLVVGSNNTLYWTVIQKDNTLNKIKRIIYINARPIDPTPTILVYTPDKVFKTLQDLLENSNNLYNTTWPTLEPVYAQPTLVNNTLYWTVVIGDKNKDTITPVIIEVINSETKLTKTIDITTSRQVTSIDVINMIKNIITPSSSGLTNQQSQLLSENIKRIGKCKQITLQT